MAQKKGNRYFVWIIMILLFIGLLGFGTGGLSGSLRSIGTVGDKEITVAQYQRALTDQLRAFEAQIGTPVTFTQAQQLGIDQAVVSQLVNQRALDNEAANLGISVGDARVREEVLRVPAFRDLGGDFDREAYRATLARVGQNEAEFETGIREEIARTLLQGAVVGGVPGPTAYADALVQFLGETRAVQWAPVTESALTEPLPGATDADLQAYFDANADDFMKPEARNITYAALTPEMIQDQLTVDEEALRELYQERIAEYMVPERRLVERLVYVDAATAEAALARVTAGEADFDALVAERGLDLADVDMGDVGRDDLGAAGEDVFAATPGDVIGPLNSPLGPALFRINAVLAAEETSFEDAEADLREELAAARARRVIEDSREGINDLIAGGATLEDLAERTDLELGSLVWTQGTQDGIAAYEAFRAAAASVEEGAFLELTEMEDGGIFALRLDSVTPPALPALNEVREDVRAAWTATQTQEAVMARAEELAAQIAPLTGFESLGLTPQDQPDLTRRSFVEGTPPGFVTEVFEMALGDVRVIDNGTGAVIVRLDSIAPPQPDDPRIAAETSAIAGQAAGGIAQDIFELYSGAVQIRTDVALNQAAINAVNAQLQ